MAKYISVLTSDQNLAYWSAVQWAQTRADIDSNNYYTAGVTLSLPKNQGDSPVGNKTITEVSTGSNSGVVIYRLASASMNSLKLASNKASKSLISSLKLKSSKK